VKPKEFLTKEKTIRRGLYRRRTNRGDRGRGLKIHRAKEFKKDGGKTTRGGGQRSRKDIEGESTSRGKIFSKMRKVTLGAIRRSEGRIELELTKGSVGIQRGAHKRPREGIGGT